MMRRFPRALLFALICALPALAQALEIRGTVSAVAADGRVAITLPAGATVAKGDAVRIEAELPGVGPVAIETLWRVDEAGAGTAVAVPEGTPSGAPQTGYAAVIETAAAQGMASESLPQAEPAAPVTAAPEEAAAAEPLEVRGTVSAVAADGRVTITLPAGASVAKGDEVRIEAEMPGVGPVAIETRWRVEEAGAGTAVAVPDGTPSGAPQTGYTAVIETTAEQGAAEGIAGEAEAPPLAEPAAPVTAAPQPVTPSPPAPAPPAAQAAIPQTQCDRLTNVPFEQMRGDDAMWACMSAVSAYPNVPRFAFGLGEAQRRRGHIGEAIVWYGKASDGGSFRATVMIAMFYENGQGLAKNPDEAAAWYRKAATQARPQADKGNLVAMRLMGFFYARGRGVTQDYGQAVLWDRKAVDQGDALAMANLAELYFNGHGVARNAGEAARLWRRAAELGVSTAMHNLGALYDKGNGVPRDPETAAQWIFRALKQGDPSSIQQMRQNSNGYSAAFRTALQRRLQSAGVYSGAIDGKFGPATLDAIAALAKP